MPVSIVETLVGRLLERLTVWRINFKRSEGVDKKECQVSVLFDCRANQFLKLSVLVTRRVSEEPIKILANASGGLPSQQARLT